MTAPAPRVRRHCRPSNPMAAARSRSIAASQTRGSSRSPAARSSPPRSSAAATSRSASRPPRCCLRSRHPRAAQSPPQPTHPQQAVRLRGARPAGPPPRPRAEPVTVQRRVSTTGTICICRQTVALGRTHTGRIVTVHVCEHTLAIELDDETRTIRRTTTNPVVVIKGSRHHQRSPDRPALSSSDGPTEQPSPTDLDREHQDAYEPRPSVKHLPTPIRQASPETRHEASNRVRQRREALPPRVARASASKMSAMGRILVSRRAC